MGTYLNPGNSGFTDIIRSNYVDKTGMIELINKTIGTTQKLTCVSRPRRFGKSYAAQMLCAYYDKTCDSRDLFGGLAISGSATFETHLNQYDVIYIDMTYIKQFCNNYLNIVEYIQEKITEELVAAYPGLCTSNELPTTLINAVALSENKFIAIIDEWDAPIRENPAVEKIYLEMLRTLFKGSGTTAKIFAAVYMTGILPIKKDGSQSAISDFREYSILNPGIFATYTGFTEDEVKNLCERENVSFEKIKNWYDGYTLQDVPSVYNPYSVMCAIESRNIKSYWKKTSAAEALMTYINMDQDGLQEDLVRLISGESLEVQTSGFQNDLFTFKNKDDVLTLLIHLGYLAYQETSASYDETDIDESSLVGIVRIPNEEIRSEFREILKKGTHQKLIHLVHLSNQLLEDTLAGRAEEVATAIDKIRESEYAPTFYNNEQALRYVIKFAYITCVDQYMKIEELPSGKGIADVVFVPKKTSSLPAILVELKWDKSSSGALAQIKEKKYPAVLKNYDKSLVLVGINYNKVTKLHSCKIENVRL